MLLASIDPKSALDFTAAALRTKDASALTWKYFATTLKDSYTARQSSMAVSGRSNKITSKRRKKVKCSVDHSKGQ